MVEIGRRATVLTRGRPAPGRAPHGRRWNHRFDHLLVLVAAFLPQLLSRPGVVDTDTKTYLYLNLSRFLRQSASMWDPSVGLGTVTHEQIGYLFPMGPFFWLVHALHIPLWVGQRLWVGAILYAAGTGILFLARTLGMEGPGCLVGAWAYMFSPYILQYLGRMSILLLPWAALGWLTALVILAVRRGGWRYPALVALVWLTISGTNASGAIYAALAPILWVLVAWFITHEHTPRQLWSGSWRTAVLCVPVSLWWLVPLAVEGKYGLSLLTYTETPPGIASSSLASEVLRGLGYWFFYGHDNAGAWAATSVGYQEHLWLIAASFAVPFLALAAAMAVRWRHRAFFVLLVAVGLILAVGAHPYTAPSAVGAVLKFVMGHTTVGLAMRSTDRATPLMLLGLAMLLGTGASALWRRSPTRGTAATALALGLVVLANPAAFDGSTVLARYTMPNPLPSYTNQAAAALNTGDPNSRVLAIPGHNTAAYTWGDTVDPVWPGILTRPFATRQQLPLGSLPSYDILYALDDPMQNGTLDTSSIAPMARLMSVGDVVVQNDLDWALFNQPQPQQFWQALQPSPAGLGPAKGYGTPRPNRATTPKVDSAALAADPAAPLPSPLEVLPVSNPRPIVRGEPASGALVVDGDGVGLDEAAADGLLQGDAAVLYSPAFADQRQVLDAAAASGATLVLTDSNRRQDFYWNQIQQNAGPTLAASQKLTTSPLDIFGSAGTDTQSTAMLLGVKAIKAEPDNLQGQPTLAMDGIDQTAWLTRPGAVPRNAWWQVTTDKAVTTDHVTVLQPVPRDYEYGQHITQVTLHFDGGSPVHVALGPASLTGAGQTVTFPTRTFHTLRVSIDQTNLSGAPSVVASAASPVGLSEVTIPGVQAQAVVSMPVDLTSHVGAASNSDRLVVLMSRQRVAPDPPQSDPEPVLARSFTLPTARSFTVSGKAAVNSTIPDTSVDALVGRTTGDGSGVTAYSSQRLAGALQDTASATLQATAGPPGTMWSPGFGTSAQRGAWIQVNSPGPQTIDHLDLQVVADGRHSVPTALQIQACDSVQQGATCPSGSTTRQVAIPPITDVRQPDGTTTVHLQFPAISGQDFTFTFTGVRTEKTRDYTSGRQIALPLGIAHLGAPGLSMGPPPSTLSGQCRSDLISVDGKPLWTSVTGSTAQALAGQPLALSTCGPDSGGITLGAGQHIVTSSFGGSTGFDVDSLSLTSAPEGAAISSGGAASTGSGATSTSSAPHVRVVSHNATSYQLEVTGASRPFWIALGQSISQGWKATVSGPATVSAKPVLLDGFGSGWMVHPSGAGATGGPVSLTVHLTWTPQRIVNLSLLLSVLGAILCLVLALVPRWSRRPTVAGTSDSSPDSVSSQAVAPASPALAEPVGVDRSSMGADIVIALALGLGAAFLVPGVAAPGVVFVLVTPLVLLALRTDGGVRALRVAVVGLGLAVLVGSVLVQGFGHWPATAWLYHYEWADRLIRVAVMLLVADLVVEHRRRARRRAE